MYGKTFESKYDGSMIGAGFHVFAVWDYIITKSRRGSIELNPKLLAYILAGGGVDADQKVIEAIDYLCRPDPKSRSKDEDGRRLVKEGEYQYRIVNWHLYDQIKSEEDRREYNRVKMAEYRARKKQQQDAAVNPKRARGRVVIAPDKFKHQPLAGEAEHLHNVEQFGRQEAERMQDIKDQIEQPKEDEFYKGNLMKFGKEKADEIRARLNEQQSEHPED